MDVNEHCYEPLDRLLEHQPAIQQTLAKSHLTTTANGEGCIVLYDITSTYFEGQYEDSEIVQFGYNRDGKRSHEQIVIGLLTNAEGCPVAVEVFPGNTQDAATVEGKVKELQEKFGVSELVFVGDRGKTTVSAGAMNKDQVVSRYKSLSRVEQAFRNMKTVSLEMRPIHHKTDSRIRAHVFLCMLAYYLQWHLKQRLAPLFEEQENALANKTIQAKDRSLTLASVLETLKSQRRNAVSVGGTTFRQLTEPTPEAQSILDLLTRKPASEP